MKTIKVFLGCFIAIMMLYSCIDDEGNYDYSELKTVKISNVKSNNQVPLGEEYVITPVIDYGDADSSEFTYTWVSEIQYEWSDTISREKVLRYKFDKIAWYMTAFIVEHVPTGALTTVQIDLNTVQQYATGWTILSEQDNKSILSYIRYGESEEDGVTYPFKLYRNFYTELQGDDLGTGPIRLERHFSDESDQILVLQESGAVEVSGVDFSKVITTNEEFYGGVPAGFEPKQAEYGSRLDILLGTNGNVYSRQKDVSYQFQSGQYSNEPFISNAKISSMYYCASLGYIYMYDELNNRIIGVQDEPQLYTGKVLYARLHPDSTHLDTFTPLDNLKGSKVVWVDSYMGGSSTRTYVQLLKKESGYYLQTFNIAMGGGSSYLDVYNGKEELFAGSHIINENSKYCIDGSTYLYFTEGNVLYYFEKSTGDVKTYYTFTGGATITDIERYAYTPQGGDSREEIAVGLDNGEFYILDASFEAMSGQKEKVIFHAKELGRIVDVQYKYGNSSTFNSESAQ